LAGFARQTDWSLYCNDDPITVERSNPFGGAGYWRRGLFRASLLATDLHQILRDQERIMDRVFAGSMLIVGVYVIAASVMLASPQLALFIIAH
jgi:hypothetical protein